MAKTTAELDREIAEVYIGKRITASDPVFNKRRFTGVARRVDFNRNGDLMLWLELRDGSSMPVYLKDVVQEITPATARYRRHT